MYDGDNECRYCEEGTYSVNGECEEITTIKANTTTGAINLEGQSWQYIAIQITSLSQPNPTNLLNFTLSPSPTPPSIYIQQNYLPNTNFHLPILPVANNENNNNNSGGDDQLSSLSLVVYFPGYFNESQWYYVGLYNPAVDSLSVNYSVIFGVCNTDGSTGNSSSSSNDNDMFGPSCSFDPFNIVTADDTLTSNDQMINIDVSSYLTLPPTSTDVNFDNIFSFSFPDVVITSPPSFAYFVLTNLPNYTTPYYLRVSTANNAVNSAPPTFYAKFNGVPSPGSFDYNVTAQSADIVSQISIPIYNTSDSQLWYLAVQLPSDFSIWFLSNCANNCSNEESNACYCSSNTTTVPCGKLTNYGTDPVGFTSFPTTLGDSVGVCTCNVGSTSSADDYKSYYDCRMYAPTTLYIIVGIILGVLAISLCFLIPAYVYLSRKRQSARDGDYAPIS